MNRLARIFRHLFYFPWWTRVRFPVSTLDAIEQAVHESEALHTGEIRFAIEASLTLPALLKGQSARDRAAEVFSLLRVWDTEENNGTLIYLLLADHDVEIVADRGCAAKVDAQDWQRLCKIMEDAFRQGLFEAGAVDGIRAVGALLARHFPTRGKPVNELPNRPTII